MKRVDKIKVFLCVFLSVFMGGISVSAQEYFAKDSTDFLLGVNTRYTDFYSVVTLDGKSYRYDLDRQFFGIRLRYKILSFSAGLISFPVNKGENKPAFALNAVARIYPRNMYIKLDGSFLSHNFRSLDYLRELRNSYENDMYIFSLDAYGLYQFNRDKINIESFFSYKNHQLRTAGSWTMNSYVKSNFVETEEGILEELGFDALVVPRQLFMSRAGLGAGYLASIKMTNEVHFLAMASFGMEFLYSQTFGTELSRTREYDFVMNFKPHGMAGITYTPSSFFYGLQFEFFPDVATRLRNSYVLEFYSFRAIAGYRWQ